MSSQSDYGGREWISEKIAQLLEKSVLKPLKAEKVPYFELLSRTKDNVFIDEEIQVIRLGNKKIRRRLSNIDEAKTFMRTVLIAAIIYEAIKNNKYPTIRDIFYDAKHTIPGTDIDTVDVQAESDNIIEDLEVMLGASREEMGLQTDVKCKVVGFMRVKSGRDIIDCSRQGEGGAYSPPTNVDRLEILDVSAEYVLVVEKDAVFNTLNMERYWEKNRCILITAGGQPDRPARRLIKRLNEELGLPVYVLTDADPYGFYIYSVYRIGSITLSHESVRLACPRARFIGVSVSDIYEYNLPKNVIIKAKEADIKRAIELKSYPWFQSQAWQRELDLFLERKEKAEIEAFSSKSLGFLEEKYLPEKIKSGHYIM
ncbi:MAG: DNA topoisomerase IV subunit A [Candidatus Nezhaarchaeota archaeon]|nr:DNA topoisomerase IV subunit A [Candidatus Nezhaarchaeota archaeon]